MSDWTTQDSEDLYQVPGWGLGIFRVNAAGHLVMTPSGDPEGPSIDLKRLTKDMRRRGIELPILVRFTDVIKARVDKMISAFQLAMQEWDYQGRYRPVFPIKVNPQSYVMRDVMEHGRPHHIGLEAGSKPELMAVLALLDDPDALIICNGYKDAAFIRLALYARQLGHECIVVLEKPDELELVLRVAAEMGVEPVVGVRAKLNAVGSGRWGTSTGDRAKFGLSVPEILGVVERLRAANKLQCLQLLHFHIGSQISQIRAFRTAVQEGARIFSELRRLGAPMQFFDVGGGLGVDYDGNHSSDSSSINYDVREYAHAIIGTLSEVFAETGTPHPSVVTESGRAMVAHHSVLLLDVMGSAKRDVSPPDRPEGDKPDRRMTTAWEIYDDMHVDRLVEALHDAQAVRRETITRFSLGLMTLDQRGYIEQMYWAICHRILQLADPDDAGDEIESLRRELVDKYFCNFSVFQSLPDIWAIDQLFPIMPIHRLDEEPTRRAVLADLTCDSDGKIENFIGDGGASEFLKLHEIDGEERYVIGAFLVGAYQEILGDLHNLFGDTHAIHVAVADNSRGYAVLHVDEGDIIEEVLGYVHHRSKDLVRMLRSKVEDATDRGDMSIEEGAKLLKTFVVGLDDYTYLSR